MSDENTLEAQVHDTIGTTDSYDKPVEGNSKGMMEEAMKALSRYVEPHNKISRPVTADDIGRLVEEGQIMLNLCMIPRGATTGAEAIAHMQIDNTDPLAFFVTKSGEFIVNPQIYRSTGTTVDSKEGCMSYPSDLPIKVQRFHRVEVSFQTLLPGEGEGSTPILSQPMKISLSGFQAKMFQHECCHINGWNIYDADFDPEGCKRSRTELDKTLKDK